MTRQSVQSIAHETRQIEGTELADMEVRFAPVGDDGSIEGMAVRFGVTDAYRSEFAASAFAGSAGRSVPMLWSHDPAQVIGSWSSVEVRADGLAVKGKLNLAVAKAQEVRALLQAGDINGMSVGFRTIKDERLANGVRRITEARLGEISIVAVPAVPGSTVTSIRSTPDLTAFLTACRSATAALKG
ncbi:MAG: HK97 family phage prohead protease [Cereibacter sphaeroides]|uniref:HK97 family phage prohead protease n=1 Tax=Cereibacter sphaeroides TaxID=1063 RepID=A0A2W5U2M2_CERSP|nr:MAG: HK97 family phage prohead protease [Cereibacter sphaeroides]